MPITTERETAVGESDTTLVASASKVSSPGEASVEAGAIAGAVTDAGVGMDAAPVIVDEDYDSNGSADCFEF